MPTNYNVVEAGAQWWKKNYHDHAISLQEENIRAFIKNGTKKSMLKKDAIPL